MKDEKRAGDYIGYEYKEINATPSMVSLLLDGYENFGWEIDENRGAAASAGSPGNGYLTNQDRAVLYLKRNRKILNKMELIRLQRNFESCIADIEELEKSKTTAATIYAIIIGIIGTAFMAGAVFAVTAKPPHYILCILLAIPAFLGWILPIFVFRRQTRRQTAIATPLIEEKYEEIYELCEKGSRLLH